MTLNDQEKKYTLNEYLRNISHLSDENYQKRIWILDQGPECQGYDDAVCDFFDIGDPIIEEYKEFGITESQYKILKKFRDEFEVFSDNNNHPEKFIDTFEWKRITEMAKEVLRAFNYPESQKS